MPYIYGVKNKSVQSYSKVHATGVVSLAQACICIAARVVVHIGSTSVHVKVHHTIGNAGTAIHNGLALVQFPIKVVSVDTVDRKLPLGDPI